MQADDARNGSEENSITREQSFSLQIQENMARIRRIATVEQLQLEYTDTRTHSQLYRIHRAATPRGITMFNVLRSSVPCTHYVGGVAHG